MCERFFYPSNSHTRVPCRQCLLCKIARSREWALRVTHELSCHRSSCFVTLSFNDENLPSDLGVHEVTLVNFLKRLRRGLEPRRIKYYASGEYGSKEPEEVYFALYGRPFGRPHYHAILFGVGIDEHEVRPWRSDLSKGFESLDGPINKAWEYGDITLGTVTFDSARYVADYVHKRYGGKLVGEIYGDLEQPFQRCSKGIGREWAILNSDRLFQDMGIWRNGKKIGMPRYYLELLFKKDDNRYILRDMVQEERFKVAREFAEKGLIYRDEIDQEMLRQGAQKVKNVSALMELKTGTFGDGTQR